MALVITTRDGEERFDSRVIYDIKGGVLTVRDGRHTRAYGAGHWLLLDDDGSHFNAVNDDVR